MNKLLSIQTIFAVIDQLSAPLRRINDTVSQFNERAKLASRAGQLFDRGARDAYRPLGALGRVFETTHRSSNLFTGSLRVAQSVIGSTTTKLAALGGALAGVYGVKRFAGSVIDTGARFEMLQARLDTSFKGDTQSSSRVLDDMVRLAKETPFEIEGLTDAFLTLKNFGIDPYSGALKAAVEQSSALGAKTETLDAIVREFGQAWARGKLQGEGIRTLVQNGVPIMELLSKATGVATDKIDQLSEKGLLTRDVMRKLFAVMASENAGASQRAMKTYTGLMSMLADNWTQFMRKVADAGAFATVKARLDQLQSRFGAFLDSPRGARFIRQLSEGMSRLVDATARFSATLLTGRWQDALRGVAADLRGLLPAGLKADVAGVWTDFRAVLHGAAAASGLLADGWRRITQSLDTITGGKGAEILGWLAAMEIASRTLTGVGLAGWLGAAASGVRLLTAAFGPWGIAAAAIGAAALVIIEKWEPLKSWFSRFIEDQRRGLGVMRDDLVGAWDDAVKRVSGALERMRDRVVSVVDSMREALRGLWDGMNSDGREFGVPKAFKQSITVSPQAPPGYTDFINHVGAEFGVRGDLLRTIFARESSAGANAGYNTSDSNARKGTPSYGPFQFIEPTFDRFYKSAASERPDLFARLGARDWQNWHQQAAVAAWAFGHGKASHWSTYRGEPIAAGGQYRDWRAGQRVSVDNIITIIQDDRRQRVMTKTDSSGETRTRVNVGRNRFGVARAVT